MFPSRTATISFKVVDRSNPSLTIDARSVLDFTRHLSEVAFSNRAAILSVLFDVFNHTNSVVRVVAEARVDTLAFAFQHGHRTTRRIADAFSFRAASTFSEVFNSSVGRFRAASSTAVNFQSGRARFGLAVQLTESRISLRFTSANITAVFPSSAAFSVGVILINAVLVDDLTSTTAFTIFNDKLFVFLAILFSSFTERRSAFDSSQFTLAGLARFRPDRVGFSDDTEIVARTVFLLNPFGSGAVFWGFVTGSGRS